LEAEEIRNRNPKTDDSVIGTAVEAESMEARELTSSHNNANQSTHAEIDEDDQHEDDVESNELKNNKESAEEEQEIVQKVPPMAISPTDTTLHKRHSSVSFFDLLYFNEQLTWKILFDQPTT